MAEMNQPSSDASGGRLFSSETLWMLVAIIVLAGMTLALTTYRLGARDVCSGNEAFEGVFVQQMVEHGKLLFPLENGRVPMYKPPLFHWTATAIDLASDTRKVTAFNLRLPSVLYAVVGVILTMLFAYDILGLEAAVLAGLTLAGAYQYLTLGRFGRVDMTLTFYEALSLFSFFWWLGPKPTEKPSFEQETVSEVMQYVLAIALGLAVLAKGPVGALLPLAAMGIFVIVEGRLREAFHRISLLAIIFAILLGSSWYIVCWVGRGAWISHAPDRHRERRPIFRLARHHVAAVLHRSAPPQLVAAESLVPIAVVMALRARPTRAEELQRPAAVGAARSSAAVRRLLDCHGGVLLDRRVQTPCLSAAAMAAVGGDARMDGHRRIRKIRRPCVERRIRGALRCR